MKQLSGLDASFIYSELPHAPAHVLMGGIYDPTSAPNGEVTFDDLTAHIADRLHLAQSFRRRLVRVPLDLDHPYWVDDDAFDLEYHVRQIALPRPGDLRQFCTQVARLHARPLDLRRPLWELYMIEGLDAIDGLPEGSFACLIKVHHAAIDGVAGVEMLTAIHDQHPDPEAPPVLAIAYEPEPTPSAMRLLGSATLHSWARPAHFARVVRRLTPMVGRLATDIGRQRLRLPARPSARTRFNAPITPHRSFDTRTVPFAQLKEIKSAVPGATANDAVLAIVTGALRSYLSAYDELPEADLVALVPISVRLPEEAGEAGNQVSAMTVAMPTTNPDPLERLAAIHASSHRSKEFAEAIGARTLAEISQFLPGTLMGLGTRAASRFANQAPMMPNTGVTNLPGPRHPLYLAGARGAHMIGGGPIADGMGLLHIVGSYCDDFVISTIACREMMPDPEFYGECVQGSFDELVDAS